MLPAVGPRAMTGAQEEEEEAKAAARPLATTGPVCCLSPTSTPPPVPPALLNPSTSAPPPAPEEEEGDELGEDMFSSFQELERAGSCDYDLRMYYDLPPIPETGTIEDEEVRCCGFVLLLLLCCPALRTSLASITLPRAGGHAVQVVVDDPRGRVSSSVSSSELHPATPTASRALSRRSRESKDLQPDQTGSARNSMDSDESVLPPPRAVCSCGFPTSPPCTSRLLALRGG